MLRGPPGTTLTYPLFPYTPFFRSWDIYSQHPDAQFATAVVLGPERDVRAVSSPDGQWILFSRGNQIMRAPRRGGPPETVMESTNELRSEEHTSELQSLMRISYAVFCLKKK